MEINLDLAETLGKLGLEPNKVLDVYLMGSHMWGTMHENSDYDLLVVMAGDYKGEKSLHANGVDATVLGIRDYYEAVVSYSYPEILTVYLPDRLKLTNKAPYRFYDNFITKMKKWHDSVIYRLKKDIAYANKNEKKGKLEKASKTRFYALCTLVMGAQLARKDKKIDFEAVKKYHGIFWTAEMFEAEYQKLLEEFLEVIEEREQKRHN